MPTERETIRKFLDEDSEMARWLKRSVANGRIKSVDVSMDEVVTIMAGPNHGGVTGSIQTKCGCGSLVWLSPSTQEMMQQRGDKPTVIMCIECALKVAMEAKGGSGGPLRIT